MNTSLTPATIPVRLSHQGSDHIRAGYVAAMPDLAFISNLDDARITPSEPYRDLLLDAGCEVAVHDPYVMEYPGVDISHELADVVKGADAVAILTGHDEYFGLDAKVLKELMGHETIRDIISRLGVADVKAFGMAWEDCEQFLFRLGYEVHVIVKKSTPMAAA